MSSIKQYFNWKSPKLYNPDSLFFVWLIVITLTLACMMVVTDLMAAALIQSRIQESLGIDDTQVIWVGKSFFFMSAMASLYAVYMALVHGFKKMFLGGTLLFFLGAICSGLATDFYSMVAFRAVAGTGGGIILAISLGYMTNILPKGVRNRAVLIYSNVFFGAGIALGALAGGFFGQSDQWHLVFFMNIPLFIAVILMIFLFLPETEKIQKPPYDYISFFSVAVFFLSLLLIVTQVKAPWNSLGWYSPFIHWCALVAVVSLLTFLIACMKVKVPLINLRLFLHPRYCIGWLGMWVIGFMIFGVTLVQIGILERVYDYQLWAIGRYVSIVGVIYFLFGMIPTLFVRWIHPRIFILIGMGMIIYSCFSPQQMTIHSNIWQIGTLLVVRSIGIAIVLGPLVSLAMFAIPVEDLPKGSALMSFTRLMAATFGSAVISLMMAYNEPVQRSWVGDYIYSRYYQVEVEAFDHALRILGWMTTVVFVIMVGLMVYRQWMMQNKGSEENESEMGF